MGCHSLVSPYAFPKPLQCVRCVRLEAGGTELKYMAQVAGKQDVTELGRHSPAKCEFPASVFSAQVPWKGKRLSSQDHTDIPYVGIYCILVMWLSPNSLCSTVAQER